MTVDRGYHGGWMGFQEGGAQHQDLILKFTVSGTSFGLVRPAQRILLAHHHMCSSRLLVYNFTPNKECQAFGFTAIGHLTHTTTPDRPAALGAQLFFRLSSLSIDGSMVSNRPFVKSFTNLRRRRWSRLPSATGRTLDYETAVARTDVTFDNVSKANKDTRGRSASHFRPHGRSLMMSRTPPPLITLLGQPGTQAVRQSGRS